LAVSEMNYNNYRNGIESIEKARALFPNWIGINVLLVDTYTEFGELKRAEQVKKRAETISLAKKGNKINPWNKAHEAQMTAAILDAQGRYREAEQYHRSAIRSIKSSAKQFKFPIKLINARVDLAENLLSQDRLAEAEVEARQVFLDTIAAHGKKSMDTYWRVLLIAKVLSKQGRHAEAQKLLQTLITLADAAGLSHGSIIMGTAAFTLGEILIDQGLWEEASAQLKRAKASLGKEAILLKNYFSENPSFAMALLQTGHTEEALELLYKAREATTNTYGTNHPRTIEIMGLIAVAYSRMENYPKAIEFFSKVIPSIEKYDSKNSRQTKLILDGYISTLAQIRGSSWKQQSGIDAVSESFRITNTISGKTVQNAIAKGASRLAMKNSQLADLARREQDSQKQISALESMLSEHLSAPTDQQLPETVSDLRMRIASLRKARQVLHGRIKQDFPQYSTLLNPPPTTLSQVQNHLKSGESLMLIYPASDQTYIWVVPYHGTPRLETSQLRENEIRNIIINLRQALAPNPKTINDIPEYDLDQAYHLYANLVKPFDHQLKDTRDLVIVALGPLGQLPFSVLPTFPVQLKRPKSELFGNYRNVPWLIKRFSICRLPGVSSFVTLRTLPKGDPSRKAFVGFGDPIYNLTQLAQEALAKANLLNSPKINSRSLKIRGIRASKNGAVNKNKITARKLNQLNRLPDTADEITGIAHALHADPKADIYLRTLATEKQIKSMDLSNRQVIAFASHALVPGELSGLNQPAIALTNPSVSGGNEDGLLTMDEIMKLKLNADWVILSACNTGSADGSDAEAISGLGRAFFYAGTRAILVSMWPVETTSARKLTTNLFRIQKTDKTLSRARALQKSMIDLMAAPGFMDASTGKVIYSYAHPLFWAPFIIVGEGGSKTQ